MQSGGLGFPEGFLYRVPLRDLQGAAGIGV